MGYKEYWHQIHQKNQELTSLYRSYWNDYSNFGSWQFWLNLLLLVLPLVVLYFKVDRRRILEILFFGYSVHILWSYSEIFLGRFNYFSHQYFLLPFFPFAINLTASLLPICYLLLYQYCTNAKKNFYVYSILLSAVIAFGLGSLEEYLGLVTMRKGMNLFYLFLIDLGVVFLAYWLTKLILKLKWAM